MTTIRTTAVSFGGGELTPEFFGRIDDTKYQTGLATCRNFVVKPHGPAENRAGTEFVIAAKFPDRICRLVPFSFALDQTLVIEVGAGYFRFHTDGATIVDAGAPYEVANSYTEADLPALQAVQDNDVLTFTSVGHPVMELRRLGAVNWTFTAAVFTSTLQPPSGVSATATPATTDPGTPTAQAYVVTTVAKGGLDESGPSTNGGSTNILSISNANPGVFLVDNGSALWELGDSVFVSGNSGMPEVNNKTYQINTIVNVGSYVEITLKLAGTPLNTTSFGDWQAGGTLQRAAAATCLNNLFDTEAYNTLAWPPVVGAERYNVYKQYQGLFGYIGTTAKTSFTDDNIAPDLSRTPPELRNPFEGAGNYPRTASYFDQRRWFGGTANDTAALWGTRTGTEANLNFSIPLKADDAVNVRLRARERSIVRHIVPMNTLVMLTDTGEWRVSGPGGGSVTADEPTELRQQSAVGSGPARPALVNANLLFAAARGGHMRELAYDDNRAGYITGDLSLRAPHLFDGYDIVDIAYAKAPLPIVWAVSSSGNLLGITYIPEQAVGAWHRHDTQGGAFEAIAVVAEGRDDVLYAVVRRVIDGDTVRYIERMRPRLQGNPADAFFVDAGKTLRSEEPVSEVSGLSWLEGETVSILADGAPMARREVVGGAVALDAPANVVTVGLPIEADLQTLPLSFEAQGYGQGLRKNVNAVFARVYWSSAFAAGPSFDRLIEHKVRSTEAPGAAPRLRDEEIEMVVPGAWGDSGQLCLRVSEPLPFCIVSMTLDVSIGG